MALPGDLTTFDLQFGPYTDAAGVVVLVGAKGKLFPVDPSTNRRIRLTHVTSGQAILPKSVEITVGEDGTASLPGIPHTGQATLSPTGYAWRVEWSLQTGDKHPSPGNLTFVVPSGATADFDLLVPAATVPAVAISQPTVASVNGQTGAVSLDAADVGAATPGDLAGKADLVAGKLPESQVPARLSDVELKAASVAAAAEDIDDRTTGLGAAAAAAFQRRTVRVAEIPRPLVIAHRGAGALVAPENTIEAFRIGAAYGLGIIDGGDWRVTSDGALVSCHDSTLDRTTTMSGPVSGLTSMRAQDNIVDPSTWFGPGYANTRMMSADQLFGELAYGSVICPEPKELAAADKLADMIDRLGLQESVLINAFSLAFVQPLLDIGCTDVLINVTTPPSAGDLTTWAAAGVTWIGVPLTFTAAQVQAIIDAGFEVLAGTLLGRVSDIPAAYLTLDISAWAADDPLYVAHGIDKALASRYRRSTDPFANGKYYHGHLNNTGVMQRGTFIGGNRWSPSTAAAVSWVLQGWGCPLANPTGPYTISFDLVFDALGGDATRWGGIFLDAPTDRAYADTGNAAENGVQAWLRVNGQLSVTRKTNGVASTAQVASTEAIAAPLVLSAGLVAGAAVTALPVNALPAAITAGRRFALPTGQIVTVATGGAASGATSVPIDSVTPTEAVASGASVPQAIRLQVSYSSTAVTATRVDTSQAVTVTAAGNGGEYFSLGKNGSVGGIQVSFGNVTTA